MTNRSPTNTLKTTPYEMWEDKKPNLKYLQIFGCEAYAKILKPLRKLDERNKSYIFIGYAPTGYWLWNKEKRKIKIARDVKFKEIIFQEIQEPVKRGTINLFQEDEVEEEEDQAPAREDEENDDEDEFEDAEEENIVNENLEQKLRRSKRIRNKPDRYTYYTYLTYKEAVTSSDKENWIQTINEENKSLKKNNTWEIIDITKLKGEKPLHNKWIFRIKYDRRYKARLVVKGYEQRGIDQQDIFSPVIGTTTIRSLFAIATLNKYQIMTFEVKTAFLYGELQDEVYLYPLEGYNCKNKVFKLKLYDYYTILSKHQ